MVGIGGGVPTNQDIRLGDVVVSMPTKYFSGISQYDFGTKHQGEPLEMLPGRSARPPDVLLTAVSALHTKYIHKEKRNSLGRALTEYVEHLTQSFPDMHGSQRPPVDELYRPEYIHRNKNSLCEDGECDEAQLVHRASRGSDVHPRTHQGLIASGNSIMRDAIERDRLANSSDVLCFEMEGAGAMADSSLGCLVIRGICDYCDSHKSDGWQDYAAAVAAAYAVELLKVVAPLHDVQENAPHSTISDMELQNMLNWLSNTRYADRQNDLLYQRVPETGTWFKSEDSFRSWLQGQTRTLFCPGNPGVGKTFLACAIIHELQHMSHTESPVGVAYFYCDYGSRKEQSVEAMFATLLRQFMTTSPHVPDAVRVLYETGRANQTRPSAQEYFYALQASVTEFGIVYIVIDALDELDPNQIRLYQLLTWLRDIQHDSRVRLLTTSRFVPAVVEHFKDAVRVDIAARGEDLEIYVKRNIGALAWRVQRDEALQQHICEVLVTSCAGM